MELKLLEFYNAENARDKILQELEDRGFYTENKEGALGLGERIVDIILQECFPEKFKPVVKKSCHSYQSPPDEDDITLDELLRELTDLNEKESLDEIFDDFLNDRNDQTNIS